MAIEVIAAGLGRTGTLSMKFALERLGFGPCHHMTEVFADAARQMPLWIAASEGRPDWDEIFRGFRSTSDYPSAIFWREMAAYYPRAKVVLATRDADDWFESTSETIFTPRMRGAPAGSVVERFMQATVFGPLGAEPTDREGVTRWYRQRNAELVANLPPERLLQFHPSEGWDRLCAFLGVAVPNEAFPFVNERGASPREPASGALTGEPTLLELPARSYLAAMRSRAFRSQGRVGRSDQPRTPE